MGNGSKAASSLTRLHCAPIYIPLMGIIIARFHRANLSSWCMRSSFLTAGLGRVVACGAEAGALRLSAISVFPGRRLKNVRPKYAGTWVGARRGFLKRTIELRRFLVKVGAYLFGGARTIQPPGRMAPLLLPNCNACAPRGNRSLMSAAIIRRFACPFYVAFDRRVKGERGHHGWRASTPTCRIRLTTVARRRA